MLSYLFVFLSPSFPPLSTHVPKFYHMLSTLISLIDMISSTEIIIYSIIPYTVFLSVNIC